VVEKNYQKGEPSIVVIEENADLRKLFMYLIQSRYGSLLDIIYLPYIKHIGTVSKNRLQHLIKKIFQEKRYLHAVFRQYFKGVKGETIYFFCRPFNPYGFYMLKRLVKYNKLIYAYPLDRDVQEAKALRTDSLNILLKKMWLGLMYGKGIKWVKYSHGGAICTYIDDSFMASVDQHITISERKQWLKGFTLKDISFVNEENYHVVFYDTPYEPGLSNKEDYCRTIEEILTVLLKYFKRDQILIKHHPSFGKSMDLSMYGRVMPDFLPGQWFHKEGVLLLSLYSICVFDASVGCSVCLVNLFKCKDQNSKDCMRRFVAEMATCDVLFPETLEDFEKIVESKSRSLV